MTRRISIACLAAALAWAIAPAHAADEPAPAPGSENQSPFVDQPIQKGETPPQQQSKEQQPQTPQAKKNSKKPPKPYEPKEPTPIRDSTNEIQIVVHNYEWFKQQHIVMQKRDFSCGAAAVATIVRYYWGDKVDEDLFLRALDTVLTDEEVVDRIKNGLAMSDLRRAAVIAGYEAVVGKLTFAKLAESKVPLVVGIKPGGQKHFVVYRGTDWEWVYIADPIRGNLRMPASEFIDQWQEKAVLVIHKPGAKLNDDSPLKLTPADLMFGDTTKQYIRAQATMPPQIKQTLR
jgi:predicted double-glycine peptidase